MSYIVFVEAVYAQDDSALMQMPALCMDLTLSHLIPDWTYVLMRVCKKLHNKAVELYIPIRKKLEKTPWWRCRKGRANAMYGYRKVLSFVMSRWWKLSPTLPLYRWYAEDLKNQGVEYTDYKVRKACALLTLCDSAAWAVHILDPVLEMQRGVSKNLKELAFAIGCSKCPREILTVVVPSHYALAHLDSLLYVAMGMLLSGKTLPDKFLSDAVLVDNKIVVPFAQVRQSERWTRLHNQDRIAVSYAYGDVPETDERD